MKGIKHITLAAACLITSTAFAVQPIPTGWYLEGNIGKSKTHDVNYGTGLSVSNSGLGWNINGGFKFIPYFAAEVGYTRYSDTTVKSGGTTVAKTDGAYAYDIAGKAILPVYDSGFELFAKLGLASIHTHTTASTVVSGVTVNTGTDTDTAPYYGVGGEYYFTMNFAGNLQWQRSAGNNSTGKLDLYSLGLSYLFA